MSDQQIYNEMPSVNNIEDVVTFKIDGEWCRVIPEYDITTFELSKLLQIYMLANRFVKVNDPQTITNFVNNNNLGRHFKVIK